MNIDLKNIVKVVIDPFCFNNKIGTHTCYIYYKNNKVNTILLDDKSIFKYLYDFMEDNCKRHFYYLL
jgi:hypothetical protein